MTSLCASSRSVGIRRGGRAEEVLPDGTYLCQDASGGWYLDPVTGEIDLAWMSGGTQWYSEEYRRRYVEAQAPDGSPWSEWDSPRAAGVGCQRGGARVGEAGGRSQP